jgi:YVTN family beta-propeller protein
MVMYIAVNAGSGTVSVIDGSTNKVIDTIKVGSNPLEDEFNPDNGYIYVANEGSSSVSVIDGATNKVIDTITGIPDPVQLAYNPSNHYMYVAGHNSNTVSVIDTRTNKLVDILTGFSDPTGVGYNSDTGNIYIGNQGSNYVSIISGSTNKVIETVTVGQGPVSPVFDPNNGNVYVTNFNSNESPGNTVSVISTTTLTPKQAIQKLIDTIDNMHLSKGATTSLEAPLNAAAKQLNRENDVAACNLLNSFLDQVDSKETNGQLTSQQAANLRQQTISIQHSIRCSSAGSGGSAGGANGDNAGDGRGSNVLPLPH